MLKNTDESKGGSTMSDQIFIADGAKVIGDVTFGKRVGVWYNAVIRGDAERIVIGDDSNIQDNCTLHTDKDHPIHIGNGVSVGHNAIVHGCTIGDNSVIGMGSILLNGAVVGKNCIIGAGALVTGKTVIPDNSIAVGNPARFLRKMTAAEIEANRENAAHYVALRP